MNFMVPLVVGLVSLLATLRLQFPSLVDFVESVKTYGFFLLASPYIAWGIIATYVFFIVIIQLFLFTNFDWQIFHPIVGLSSKEPSLYMYLLFLLFQIKILST